jgi:hypothetical protein
MPPLAIDLFCGLGGWTEGLLAEGYRVVGFDIERHVYGEARYPAQLVLMDVLTIHGAQFASASLIVASPPCQAYSYRAMPWKRAKALPPPDNSLFEACFRIQREASEAAGHHIPLVVENVCGAQKWVGRARWHFGSFYLWGDVPALMPMTKARAKVGGITFNGYGTPGYKGAAFNGTAEQRLREETKNDGGSWFAVAHNTTSGHSRNPVNDGAKTAGHVNKRDGHSHTRHMTNQAESEAVKNGDDWFSSGADCSPQRRAGSKSSARKAASAHIAKIPLVLARHIARAWHPDAC